MKLRLISRLRTEKKGAVLVLVAVLMIVFMGIAALAVDLSTLYVVQNELQNSADAGALAGALSLYNVDGTAINPGANQVAFNIATTNLAQNSAVDINWSGGNTGDIERGHWSFATRTFTENESLVAIPLWGRTEEELDADTSFINAVRVVTRREDTQAAAFFSRILGFTGFTMGADAVAYIGFAAPASVSDLDQPIAICSDAILQDDGSYECNIARMINSGTDPSSSNTAGWTSFSQDSDSVCSGTNSNELKPLVSCGPGGVFTEPDLELATDKIATTGGANQVVFNILRDCWWDYYSTNGGPLEMMLPVVECEGNNIGNCPVLSGAVTVQMLWMTEAGTAWPEDTPETMKDSTLGDWSWAEQKDTAACSDLDTLVDTFDFPAETTWTKEATQGVPYTVGMARWDCFVRHFDLKNADDTLAPFDKKSMYFKPVCAASELTGRSGGQNFGVLARIPVLVE